MKDNSQIDNIKKNLENPVFTNLDILLDKARVKLISFSLLGFFIYHYNIDIAKGLSFFGMTIKDITINDISIMLALVLIYILVNFIWMSCNRFIEWNIRRTGTCEKIIKNTKSFADINYEYPSDAQQSSLYYYWLSKEKSISDIETTLKDIKIDEDNCKELNKTLKKLTQILSDKRIQASLKKFDETFWLKIKGENRRWLVFDFILPVVISSLSICLLLKEQF